MDEIKNVANNILVLFLSKKFKHEDGYLVGGYLQNSNNGFFITTTKDNLSNEHIGQCENNTIKLFDNNGRIFLADECLAIHLQQNKPMIISFSYDHDMFQKSEYIESFTTSTNDYFKALHSSVKIKRNEKKSDYKKKETTHDNSVFRMLKYYFILFYSYIVKLLRTSHWFMHIEANFESIFIKSKSNNYTTRIEKINFYWCKAFDFIIGIITLYFLIIFKKDAVETLLQSTKFIINGLRDVLNTLMDSPAGLKLNYALNHTLAIFFFYHISLWRAFIQSVFTVSVNIVYIFTLLGSLGLSYQIALCADLLMFLTFHVYCIYVYASRFYRLQIYTISSLWRLFIGRKYNPLKQRVDSFQYSHNQLFVGTLCFTVLLFLLPTTFLYYIVFTMFRVWVLMVCKCMSSIANFLSTVPIYLMFLRLINSSTIKGDIRIYVTKNELTSNLQLHASLDRSKSWFKRDKVVKSGWEQPKISLNEIVNNICTGRLI